MAEPPDPGGMMIEDDVVAEGQNSNFDPNQGEAAVPAGATAGVVMPYKEAWRFLQGMTHPFKSLFSEY